MNTPRAYKRNAADCLKLAGEANDAYVKAALTEFAAEFSEAADTIEQERNEDATIERRHDTISS